MKAKYKGVGSGGKSKYWDILPVHDMDKELKKRLSDKAFKIKVKSFELITELGEIIISTQILPTIELVEGNNIDLQVNNSTGQIIIGTKNNVGTVGTKSVDELTIGNGKVLAYDSNADKLIYVNINDIINAAVNATVGPAVQTALNATVDQSVDNALNAVLSSAIQQALTATLPTAVDSAVQTAISQLPKETYYSKEIPVGDIDGINVVFTIQNIPIPGKEEVYLNGVLQELTLDYSIVDNVITFVNAPNVNSNIMVSYFA